MSTHTTDRPETAGAAAQQEVVVRCRGLFYGPTVLVDVNHDMDCMREETFGPTLPVMKVRSATMAFSVQPQEGQPRRKDGPDVFGERLAASIGPLTAHRRQPPRMAPSRIGASSARHITKSGRYGSSWL